MADVQSTATEVVAAFRVSLARQIDCVEREILKQKKAYKGWVQLGRMTPEDAIHETRAMEAVLDTLRDMAGVPTAVQRELI